MPQSPQERYEARQAERERKEQERAPKPWYWFRQRDPIARFTLYLGIFTLALVAVGVLQWCSIRGQLIEMKSGSLDTHNLALSAQLDQRAWLGTSNSAYTITASEPIHDVVMALNTGKTPASGILCRITGTTEPKGHALVDADIVYPPDLPVMKQGTIFPNQYFPMTAGGQKMDPEKQKVWFKNIQSGDWIQYFFGDIRYRDIFGYDHWTHFCTQYVPETRSGTPCPIYNDTDSDREQSYSGPNKAAPSVLN